MKLFKILFLFICVSSVAQSKVGTIDVDYIISKLPELTTIQSQLEVYGKDLDAQMSTKLKAYEAAAQAYQAGEAGFTNEVKVAKQQEILQLEEDISKFQSNGSTLVNLKRDELLRPSYQKIGKSLEKIAKAQGYTQVLQIGSNLAYIDPAYDLTIPVMNDLGIKDE